MGTFVSGAIAADGVAYTPASGADTVLVWIPYQYRSGIVTASAQDFGGTALTEDHDLSINIAGGGDPSANLSYLLNPGTASQTLSLTWSNTSANESGWALTLEGIDQAAPKNNSDSATFTATHTPALTYSAEAGDVVVYWKFYGGNITPAFTTPAGFTLRRQHNIITAPAYRGVVIYTRDITSAEVGTSIGANTSGGTVFGGLHGVMVFTGASGGEVTTPQSGTATSVGTSTVATSLTLARVLSVITNGVASAVRSSTFVRLLAGATLATPTFSRAFTSARVFVATVTGLPAFSRTATFVRLLATVSLGTAISAIGALLTIILTTTAVGSPSFSSASVIGRLFTALSAGAATSSLVIGKVLSASVSGLASVSFLNDYVRQFVASAIGTVIMSRIATYIRAFSSSVIGSVLVAAVVVIGVSISAVVAVIGNASLTKVVGKSLSTVAIGTLTILKLIGRTFIVTATGTSTQNEGYITSVAAAVLVNGIVSATQLFIVGVVSLSTLIRRTARNLTRNITRIFKK